MKLWLLSQDENDGYDTYDSVVVAAENEVLAKAIHPSQIGDYAPKDPWVSSYYRTWASSPDKVNCKIIGDAIEGTEPGVILASFNAG